MRRRQLGWARIHAGAGAAVDLLVIPFDRVGRTQLRMNPGRIPPQTGETGKASATTPIHRRKVSSGSGGMYTTSVQVATGRREVASSANA
jgi:hypothetical protein